LYSKLNLLLKNVSAIRLQMAYDDALATIAKARPSVAGTAVA
jgi:hypothetical protein